MIEGTAHGAPDSQELIPTITAAGLKRSPTSPGVDHDAIQLDFRLFERTTKAVLKPLPRPRFHSKAPFARVFRSEIE